MNGGTSNGRQYQQCFTSIIVPQVTQAEIKKIFKIYYVIENNTCLRPSSVKNKP